MANLTITKQEKIAKIKDWLSKTEFDADVNEATLGKKETSLTTNALLLASAKLIKVNKREVEPDDRDNLKYSKFLGLENAVEEHVMKDAGKLQKKAKLKIQQKKNLSWLQPGFFSSQIRSTIIGNSLAQNMEGINPIEHFDVSHRVTKMGEGGISSSDSIPAESRQINDSSFGFFDPLHIPESTNIGVTSYVTDGVVLGRDGKLYRIMKNKEGKLVWVDHMTLLNSKVLVPEF